MIEQQRVCAGSARQILLASGMLAALATTATAETMPRLTLQFINNTSGYIFPVFSTGPGGTDPYLQAWLGIRNSQLKDNPFPHPHEFRIYVNGLTGIAPGATASLSLPVTTQIVPTAQLNPKAIDQYLTWWGGSRVDMFASATKQPPASLKFYYNLDLGLPAPTPLSTASVPTCSGCTKPLIVFEDPAGLPNNIESQLVELNLGALSTATDPVTIQTNAVDYDFSAVNNVALPMLVEPLGNPAIGYVGSPEDITTFQTAMKNFRVKYKWPRYTFAGLAIRKIPSPLDFLPQTTNIESPYGAQWAAKLTSQYLKCTDGGTAAYCATVRDVDGLMQANWTKYQSLACHIETGTYPPVKELISNVYGYSPFSAGCPATSNLFQDTPGYLPTDPKPAAKIQAEFTQMQDTPNSAFNPYTTLIHSSTYLNMPNVYAFSVDDGLGNVNTTGTGIVMAIGGTGGLPNPNPYGDVINVQFGGSAANHFTRYGVCTKTPTTKVNVSFQSFSVAPSSIPCTVSFQDSSKNIYNAIIAEKPPYPPQFSHDVLDCSKSSKAAWCNASPGGQTTTAGGSVVVLNGPLQ